MGTKRVGFARIKSLINENTNALQIRKSITQSVGGAATLTVADSGKEFHVDQSDAFTITLPADAAGVHFKFLLTTADSNDVKIDGGSSNAIKGWAFDPTTSINSVDNNMVVYKSGTAVVGDVIHLYNDGTSWICNAWSGATNGIVGANS